MEISVLRQIELREIWKHEAVDFTNWLATPENLELLGDELGIGMSGAQTEVSVGKFKVDIVAEEEISDRKIVIENQLERTDHDHLGKIITYASGLDAEIVVWIVKSVEDEHKRAVDWLNEHTDSKINFFAIQIEAYRIDDSLPAPRFNVIAKPNNWAKAVKSIGRQSELSDTKLLQLEFWTKFKEYAQGKGGKLKLGNPYAESWFVIRCGFSKALIELTVNSQKAEIACGIYIRDSKETFHLLHEHRSAIEDSLSEQLGWLELPEKKASRIKLARDGDLLEQDEWDSYHSWLLEKVSSFQRVFSQYI